MIVSKHGCCPWINTTSDGRGDHGGSGGDNVDDNVNGERDAGISGLSSSFSAAPTVSAAAAPSPRHILGRNVRKALKVEARAELVTMLWVESCHRAQELRQPSGCEQAFRPQAWPIRRFSEPSIGALEPPTPLSLLPHPAKKEQVFEIAASAAVSASPGAAAAAAARKNLGGREGEEPGNTGGVAAVGGPVGRRFAVAVTGFVGAERAGLEKMIERMGAELCKSLKKRVTTHLVCKEVRGRGAFDARTAGDPGALFAEPGCVCLCLFLSPTPGWCFYVVSSGGAGGEGRY